MKTNLILFSATLIIAVTTQAQNKQIRAVPPTTKTPINQLNTSATNTVINIAAVGDIMMGTSYPNAKNLPLDSGKSSFKTVEKYLKGNDITFGNLEGPLLDIGQPAYYKMHFRSSGKMISIRQDYEKGIQEDQQNRAATRVIQLTKADFPKGGLDIATNGDIQQAKTMKS